MNQKAAATGPGAMFFVAIEQSFPPGVRILNDELALPILPLGSRIWVRLLRPVKRWLVRKTEAKVPGLWAGITTRKRYIGDALAEHPAAAIVDLGAGFDTRGCTQAGTPVWEVDLPLNIEAKRSRIRSLFGDVPRHLNLVPLDLDRGDIGSALTADGYSPDVATFFIWEGVSQYLSEEGTRGVFDFLAKAPANSRLVFTYVPKDFIDGDQLYGQEHLYREMLGEDSIWRFGIDPEGVDGLLAGLGWRVVEHLGYDELGERYVKPTGRELDWMAIERIVHARKS
ncbi:MAG: SAM-dependent methyltransferase [Holophagae bacterium]|jgi:methyltransferase (TIGR00027 family)